VSRGYHAASWTLLLIALLQASFLVTDSGGGVRIAVALAFTTVTPGWAITGWAVRTMALAYRAALSVALSLSLFIGVAEAMLLARMWHPTAALLAVAVLSAVALGVQVLRTSRRDLELGR
jgi:hypothetical protein